MQLKLKKLPNLEQKLKKLENGVSTCLRTTDLALQILSKDHSEYEDIKSIDKDLNLLEKDTEGYRTGKDKLTDELENLIKAIDNAQNKMVSMNEIIQIQKRSSQACEDHEKLDTNIDDGLHRLQDYQLKLEDILKGLRDHLKKEADKLVEDMEDKLFGLERFLNPSGTVPDSIQRPTNLKELLDDTYILRDDPDYKQYHEYCELVNTNMTK